MPEVLANGGLTYLAEDLDASETGVDVVDGSVFPATGNFRIIIDGEIMICTSRTSNTLTVTRGDESTTATIHGNGTEVAAILTAGGLQQYIDENSTRYDYILIRDEKAQNTNAGTFTSGAWRTRDLNTEVTDVGEHASIASNQITLAAGTYIIHASAPAYDTNNHQIRLQNITDTTTIAYGTSESNIAIDNVSNRSFLSYKFTIASTKVIELQHQCNATSATFGLGVAANFGTEVYAVVELWREI